MPEESFEQQARRKAEEFRMEPAPEVWKKVQAAVAPEKRRRRVLLWWWLPLCLAGGIGMWLLMKQPATSESKIAAVALKGNEQKEEKGLHTIRKGSNAKAGSTEVVVEKKYDRKNESGRKKAVKQEGKKSLSYPFGEAEKSVSASFDENNLKPERKTKPTAEAKDEVNANNITITEAQVGTKEKTAKALPGNKQDAMLTDTLSHQSFQNDGSLQSLVAVYDSLVQKKGIEQDSASLQAALAIPNAVKIDSKENKKMKLQKKSWQTGVMAEIGVVSWGKELLSNGNGSTNKYASLPSVGMSNDSLINAGTSFQQAKNGVSAGAGVVLRKDLSKKFYLITKLGYRFQQYKIYQLLQVSVPQPASSISYLIGSNGYQAHFINLNVSAGTRLLTGKRNALSAEAGIENGFLFTAITKQKKDSSQSSNADRNNSVTANFYRWQPQLSLALSFDWHKADKISFQVSPFIRYGLRSFQKNGNSYKDNHLVSAGIQAIYFFK